MEHPPRVFVSLFCLTVVLAARPNESLAAAAPDKKKEARDVLVLLPVGEEQRYMFDLMTQLRRGLAAGAAGAAQPRYRDTVAVDQLTGDKKLVSQLQRAGLHYGMSRDEEQALVTRVRLPRKLGSLGGLLQTSLTIAESGSLHMQLELYELGEAGLELKLRKSIRAKDLEEMRTRVGAAGRVLAVQEDQGGRPEYAYQVAPTPVVRRGREVVLDLGETADPELDAFDWAWCQAAGPTPARPELAEGRWRRGDRQVRFVPGTEGQYTFLLWAGEILRDEREPACEIGSAHVASIPILVEPYKLTLQGLGAWDPVATGADRGGGSALRVGLNWRLWGKFGARGMLDLLERQGATDRREAKMAYFAALALGPSYDLRVGRDLLLGPFGSLFWRLPPDGDPAELGWGLGGDVVVGLRGPWAAIVSLETLSAAYTRFRGNVGIAYRH